jgi:uncharacterized membrane-anchored protein
MPNKTKVPTNKDIMDELKDLKRSTTIITVRVFFASIGLAGIVLFVSAFQPISQSPKLYGLFLVIICFIGLLVLPSLTKRRKNLRSPTTQ